MAERFLFASAFSTEASLPEAVDQVAAQVKEGLNDHPAHLALAFLSGDFAREARQAAQGLMAEIDPQVLMGCTAEGVISRAQEIEGQTAITLMAASLPGVKVSPFILQARTWPALLLDREEFQHMVDAPEDTRLFITLGDPFSSPMDDVLYAFNENYPGIPMVGGMASAALRPHGNSLFVNDRVTSEGVVGVALAGALDVDVVVSQGCRPIWEPFIVQEARRNLIMNLEGRPPLAWIQELVPKLSEEDKALLQNGLFMGRAVKSGRDTLGRGDFLIRGVVGFDQESGAIAIGDSVQEGETVQFHIRDAQTAREDLEMMLVPQGFREPPDGALLFSCNGRGTRLFGYPDGDVSVINSSLGETPLAGFFCAGEIGPIGGHNFLHGQTASLALFRPLEG